MAQLRRRSPGPSQLPKIDNSYYALRPVEHIQGRRVHSFGGTVVVQQVRSHIGRKHSADVHQTLKTIELGTIDDVCIVDETDPLFEQIQSVQQLLSVEKLDTYVPPGDFRMWAGRDGTLMYKDDYGTSDRPAEIVVIGDGEYLQAETVAGRVSVLWSSSLDLMDTVTSLGGLLGQPTSSPEEAFLQLKVDGKDRTSGGSGGGALRDVLDYVRDEQPAVAFLRARFTVGELVWSAPFPRIARHSPAFAEVAVRFDAPPTRQLVQQLLEATASAELKAHLVDVESQITQLTAA